MGTPFQILATIYRLKQAKELEVAELKRQFDTFFHGFVLADAGGHQKVVIREMSTDVRQALEAANVHMEKDSIFTTIYLKPPSSDTQ